MGQPLRSDVPMAIISAVVSEKIRRNRMANRNPDVAPYTFTVHDIVAEYALDGGTYWHDNHKTFVSVAEQLVRNELLVRFRLGEIWRPMRADGAPRRRDGDYEYVAVP